VLLKKGGNSGNSGNTRRLTRSFPYLLCCRRRNRTGNGGNTANTTPATAIR